MQSLLKCIKARRKFFFPPFHEPWPAAFNLCHFSQGSWTPSSPRNCPWNLVFRIWEIVYGHRLLRSNHSWIWLSLLPFFIYTKNQHQITLVKVHRTGGDGSVDRGACHSPADLKSSLFTSEIVLKKTKFSFAVTFNWRWFLGSGWGYVCTSPFNSRTPVGADLCRPYVGCLSLFVHMCLKPVDFEDHVSLVSPSSLKLLPLPFPQASLSPGGRDFLNSFHLGQSVPRFLTLHMLSGSG